MLKTLKAYGFLLLLGGGVVALDQAAKAWVRSHLPFGAGWTPIPSLPWLQIIHWKNHGMAFGLGQEWGTLFLALGALYVLGVLIAFPALSNTGWWVRWGMAIQWGGALGNLIDRWQQGYVTDFIAVKMQHFPVFNLADAAISISVVFLLAGEFFANRDEQENAPETGTPAAEVLPAAAPSPETPHDP